jgi:lipoprotein-releasing system ATP-binding protein
MILKLEKISKYYTDKSYHITVLEELDLEIEQGEMIAITGTSGSGKSTLLHIMGLLDTSSSGTIYFHGEQKSISDKNIEKFRNTHIGFVFQFHYLLADFSAVENVALPALIAGDNWSDAQRRASDILADLDMSHRLTHYPNQLSGGEQQRVAIGRALINNPDIIIADEPTGNLDQFHSDEIMQIFNKINAEKNQTIILATHDTTIAGSLHKHYSLSNHKLILN